MKFTRVPIQYIDCWREGIWFKGKAFRGKDYRLRNILGERDPTKRQEGKGALFRSVEDREGLVSNLQLLLLCSGWLSVVGSDDYSVHLMYYCNWE